MVFEGSQRAVQGSMPCLEPWGLVVHGLCRAGRREMLCKPVDVVRPAFLLTSPKRDTLTWLYCDTNAD